MIYDFQQSRDPYRTPMIWTNKANAGFCMSEATPWLPINDNYRSMNVEVGFTKSKCTFKLMRKTYLGKRGGERFLCPVTKKVVGYYVIPSEILSVSPSAPPTILLPATPPTVLGQSFSNFTGSFRMVWRYAYLFFQNPEFIFYHIFCIFNLDFFSSPNTTCT